MCVYAHWFYRKSAWSFFSRPDKQMRSYYEKRTAALQLKSEYFSLESTVPMHVQLRLYTQQLFLDFCESFAPKWPLIFFQIFTFLELNTNAQIVSYLSFFMRLFVHAFAHNCYSFLQIHNNPVTLTGCLVLEQNAFWVYHRVLVK